MTLPAEEAIPPSRANLKAREWFQDARFGMFIHWGLYSHMERGDWTLHYENMKLADYVKHAAEFNPVNFRPKEWVSLAKRAGMKYMTITTKHHEGFALWNSKVSDWNIVDRTPYGKDVIRMLADECRRQDMKLFFYYSHLDWHHPDYFPRGWTAPETGRPEAGDWSKYMDYMNEQVRELCTNYGRIAGFWFDGVWDRKDAEWQLTRTYNIIHKLQPQALIGNNHHHQQPNPGEDFQMWERDLPGHSSKGFTTGQEVASLPLETCDTLNCTWGYTRTDRDFKTPKQIIHYLVRSASRNANLLLNVGPGADGSIDPEFADRLKCVGKWTSKYGESVYGTRGISEIVEWGGITKKGNTFYLHVLEPDKTTAGTAETLLVKMKAAVKPPKNWKARVFGMKKELKIEHDTDAGELVIHLPRKMLREEDTIIVLAGK